MDQLISQFKLSLSYLQSFLDFEIFSLQGNPVTPMTVFTFLFVLLATLLISRYIRSFLRQRITDQLDSGLGHTIDRLVHYTMIILGIFVAFNVIGLSLSSLAIIAGGLGVGIGFGLQTIASNFVSGLILMIERPIEVGDMVTIEDELGSVESINLRSTHVTTLDNVDIIIPNSTFIEENVINWSHGEEQVRLRCPVGVAYGTDVHRVRDLLLEIAGEKNEVMSNPEPKVAFREFGDSSLNFELRVWIKRASERARVLSELNFRINDRFAEEEIEIPFPQRDVHFRSGLKVQQAEEPEESQEEELEEPQGDEQEGEQEDEQEESQEENS